MNISDIFILIGLGTLIGLIFVGIIILLLWIYRRTIMLWYAEKKIKKVMDILMSGNEQDQIKQFNIEKIQDPLIIIKAKEKLKGVKKNEPISEKQSTATDTNREYGRSEPVKREDKPKSGTTPRQRNIPTRTTTFSRKAE